MNFQNIPASGDMLIPIQGQLIAPEGYICVDIDYSQLEPHVTAFLSGDKALTNDLLSGVCLHCRALSWVPRLSEGKTYEEIYQLAKVEENPEWVLKRKKAKGINFKRAYGGGARSLAEAEDLPIEDIQAIFDAQELAYPGVKHYNEDVVQQVENSRQSSRRIHFAKRDVGGRRFEYGIELLPIYQGSEKIYKDGEYRHFGTFTSITGRRYTFDELGQLDRYGRLRRRFSSTETKNYMIQGTAHDIISIASIEVALYVHQHKDVRLIRTIHDALSFYIKKGTEHLHIPVLCDIMSDIPKWFNKYINIKVPFKFPVEAKIGNNFGQMENYHHE